MEPNAEVREGIHLGIEYARRQWAGNISYTM